MTRILVTGANGFVGRHLCESLNQEGHQVRALVRGMSAPIEGVDYHVGDLADQAAWPSTLAQVECVVHLAARAHVLTETSDSPLEIFRATNCHATLDFAKACLEAGVKRFVFISSIGVNGAETTGASFTEQSPAAPHAPYAVSKFEAEQALTELVNGSSMELVIIRPPLVYAGHAPGNFRRLLKLVSTGIPMPFRSVHNLRSMVSLGNLVSFIKLCTTHPDAAGELFLVSDDESLSLPQILKLLGEGMQKPVLLVPVPVGAMKFAAGLVGKASMLNQLCGSLTVDSAKSRRILGWVPPESAREAMIAAGQRYKASQSAS